MEDQKLAHQVAGVQRKRITSHVKVSKVPVERYLADEVFQVIVHRYTPQQRYVHQFVFLLAAQRLQRQKVTFPHIVTIHYKSFNRRVHKNGKRYAGANHIVHRV